jgi:hypothetical protein
LESPARRRVRRASGLGIAADARCSCAVRLRGAAQAEFRDFWRPTHSQGELGGRRIWCSSAPEMPGRTGAWPGSHGIGLEGHVTTTGFVDAATYAGLAAADIAVQLRPAHAARVRARCSIMAGGSDDRPARLPARSRGPGGVAVARVSRAGDAGPRRNPRARSRRPETSARARAEIGPSITRSGSRSHAQSHPGLQRR